MITNPTYPMELPHLSHPKGPAEQDMLPGRAPTLAKAPTLQNIADIAGVSAVAVSVVLNNSRSKVRVSETTRQRILDTARQLNYRPNELARALMRRQTNVIGFCNFRQWLFDPLHPFYGSLMKGAMMGCETHKKNLLLHGTFGGAAEEDVFLQLLNGQVDGLILYVRETTPLTERLAASHLPVVTLCDAVPGLPSVSIDSESGGRLLARHLAAKGYRRAVYWVDDAVLPTSIQQRYDGFQSEAALHGMAVELFWPRENRQLGEELLALLQQPNPPQVIAAYNDYVAECLILECEAAGVRVPQDLAITGFDGFADFFGWRKEITSVRAPWIQVAQAAVSILVEQCNGGSVPLRTELPVELIEGTTT